MSAGVLVVDSEPQTRRALRASLHGAGYEVETADTAEGALTALAVGISFFVVGDLIEGSGRYPHFPLADAAVNVLVLLVLGLGAYAFARALGAQAVRASRPVRALFFAGAVLTSLEAILVGARR